MRWNCGGVPYRQVELLFHLFKLDLDIFYNFNIDSENAEDLLETSQLISKKIAEKNYKDLINKVVQEMVEIKTEAELLQSTFNLLHLKELSRKEYASYVLMYPKVFHDFLFKNYERDITWEEYILDWNANKWDKVLEQCEQYKIKKAGDEI